MNAIARRSLGLACACLLLAFSASAQQPPPPASDTPPPQDAPGAAEPRHESKAGEEKDDPRERLNSQRFDRGIPTMAYKQHLFRQRQEQMAKRGAPDAPIVATTGPQWVPIGPTDADYEQNGSSTLFARDSGRARAILPHPTDPNTVYFLTSGGGLWVTNTFNSNPPNWRPLTDALVTTSGGSVAFGRTPSVLYLGLGDPFDVINVGGVMEKSIDGGTTWTTTFDLGAPFSIRDVKVDLSVGTTTSTDIVLVATDLGLFRSTDGGTTYTQVPLNGILGLSVWSIVQTTTTVAGVDTPSWLANAQPCAVTPAVECGSLSAIYISTDKGATWNPTTNAGAIFAGAGRTTLAAGAGAVGNKIVYAFSENTSVGAANDQRGLFRSTDGGQTWTDLLLNAKSPSNPNSNNPNMDLMHNQAWYNQMMVVDPGDTTGNTVYLGGNLSSAVTKDGGATWTLVSNWLAQFSLPYVHADFHAAAISNINGTTTLFFGGDGGIFASTDNGTTWTSNKNIGLQTFLVYTLTSTPAFPAAVLAGFQDNGSRVRKGTTTTYNQSHGGDGVGTGWSQANSNTAMVTVPKNNYAVNLSNDLPDTIEGYSLSSPPLNSDPVFLTSVATPTAAVDPTGKVFYTYSFTQVYKTVDGGLTWTVIGKIGGATNTITLAGGVTALRATPQGIGVSPLDLMHVGVIGGGGTLALTADGGTTWSTVGLNGLSIGFQSFTSSFTWVTNQIIYVTSTSATIGAAHVVKSIDGGANWTRADTGLPDVPVHRVVADPRDATHNTLIAASLQGVFRSIDGGTSWAPYGTGLSNAYVTDIYMPPDGSFLRMASYGRGLWELPFLTFNGATLTDDVTSCDHNGTLANGESGHLTITLHNDGGATLSSVSATVTSTNAAVSFANGNSISFPSVSAGADTTAPIVVSLNGAVGIQQADFQIAFNDPALSLPGPINATASFRVNSDETPSGTTDGFDATATPWILAGTAPISPDIRSWQRRQITALEHRWTAIDSSGITDVALVSPVFQVGAGAFTFSFEQRYSFEFQGGATPAFFDGMVIEISSNGGATWTDVGGPNIAPSYDHLLAVGGGNPIENHPAFGGRSVGYPNFVPVTVNLGTAFASQNVQIRYRIGTDAAGGAPGVEIRNFTATGLTNTPFTAVVPHNAVCASATTIASSLNPSTFGASVTFTATATGGVSVPTGTVTFKDGATTLGTGPLNGSGVATFATAALAVGSHTISAAYGGDAGHSSSTSANLTQTVNPAVANSTATALASSVNPSVVAQSVTFTATVTSGSAGTPTGTVTFKDGAATIGTSPLNGSAVATLATSALTAGSHSITAVYGGDTNFTGSTSAVVTQAVKGATSTALASSANPSANGQSVTFTATVTSATAGTPTGTVTFKDGAVTLGTGNLNGSAVTTFTTTALTVASHSITAVYGGDASFAGSTSSALSQTVNPASTATAVTSSANPSTSGQSVTFTATVTSGAPGTSTGNVTFKDGAVTLGTSALNTSAIATFTTAALGAGSHSISAVYAGDINFTGSTSSTLTQTVNLPATATALASSANPSLFGQSVTFTATVTSTAAGTPTGTVTFKDGANTLATGALTGGVATFATAALTVGSHSVTAVYAGDTSFAGSTSTVLSQTLNTAATTTAVASSLNPSTAGQSVTFTSTVSAVAPGAGTPTGTITFKDGATALGTGAINGSGVATFSTQALTSGSHSITAVYVGDTNFTGSASSTLTQTVNLPATATALASSANSSVFGQSVTFTATVTSTAAGTPTGTVTFKDGPNTLGTGALAGGVATFATVTLAPGSHSVTAVYGGDTSFAGSTSTALTQTVNTAATTTAVASSLNPSTVGQSVTFTANVSAAAPGAGTPTGTVTFKDSVTTLGTGALTAGVATFSTSTLTAGSHSITAVYGADTNFAASTSAALTQTVKGTTSTALTSAPNPSANGQSVLFTATVTSTPAGTPTGTVTFKDGGTTIGIIALNSSGVATFSTTTLAQGNHSITAVYAGDSNFATSTSNIVNQAVNLPPTVTAVLSSVDPSVFGQSVTFTATITSTAAGTPTGTVTFKDGATTLGTGALNGAAMATFSSSALTVATHSITAVYAGDATFAGSTSVVLTQVVNTAATSTALASSSNPAAVGQSVTFTATVSALAPGAGTPTGTVTFKDGATTLGPGTLSGGIATFATAALASGSHSITAVYGGDANFATSTSAPFTQSVKGATTTALVSSVNPSANGQSVTFTATVTSTAPGTPTGNVTFKDGATTFGIIALNGSGVAAFSTTTLALGSHSITAVYAGDANFTTSTSNIVTQAVNLPATTSTVTALPNPSVFGQSVTFTATITATTAGIPTGTVTFKDGATTLGAVPLNGAAMAAFSSSALAVGSHSITAAYAGDANFTGSTSIALTQTVNQASTLSVVTSAPSPSIFGQSVTLTATVTPSAPGAGTPTGTVTFKDGATTLGTGALNASGVATFATTAFTAGTHSITAVYGGDTNFATSTSVARTQTVNSAATSATVTSSANPSTSGMSVTFTATISVAAPGAGTPTGTVTFKDGAATLGTGALNAGGVATFAATALAAGSHSITAVYAGDANFTGSTSSALAQTVTGATSTAITSSANPSNVAQSVTFTATVTSTATATPTGNVAFKDGATTVGTTALNASGVATFATTTLAAGSHSITAAYAGEASFAASTSTALTQTVNAPDFSVSATPLAQTITAGSPGTVKFTVTPLNGSTQTVTFTCGNLPANSSCAFVPPSVPLDGKNAATSIATIGTKANSALPPTPSRPSPPLPLMRLLITSLGWLALLLLGLCWKRRPLRRFAVACILLLGVTLGLGACAGPGKPAFNGTPPGTYNISVTAAAAGAQTHSATVTVIVK